MVPIQQHIFIWKSVLENVCTSIKFTQKCYLVFKIINWYLFRWPFSVEWVTTRYLNQWTHFTDSVYLLRRVTDVTTRNMCALVRVMYIKIYHLAVLIAKPWKTLVAAYIAQHLCLSILVYL